MKTKEKLEIVNKYVERLNLRLKERTFKVAFNNKGANRYCLTMLGQDYKFNTYDARYDGINSVKVYSTENALGFNTHVRYTITTSQGFQYTADTWMLVEPSGNSYVIKDML